MNESAVATRPDSGVAAPEREQANFDLIVAERVKSIAGMSGDVERWAVTIPIPPKLQYRIRGVGTSLGQGRWRNDYLFSLKAEAYDILNKVMGVQIHTPPFVNDSDGKQVPNPIHTPQEAYIRMVGIGYNDLGQQLVIPADIGINYIDVWQNERLKKDSKKLDRDPEGEIFLDPKTGLPRFSLSDADEFKAMETLLSLRQFGLRRAESICRARTG